MNTRKWLVVLLLSLSGIGAESLAGSVAAPPLEKDTKSRAGFGSLASEAGAALNSHLLNGGGTDDTAVMQAVLNRAADGTPVHLVVDGVTLVSGLNVYGNTTIECLDGGGLFLKDGSSRAIIRNAHRSRDAITDEHITVRGCFLNGNREHQPGADQAGFKNREADGTFISGLQFLGVNYLTIENVTLWNIRAFGALIGNANRIDIKNVIIDHGAPPDVDMQYANTDGLHFKGPLRYLTINGIKLRTGDDGLAFNADDWMTDDLTVHNDFGPYVRQGPITDVSVNNVELMDAVQAMRFLSSKQRIDRVVINNVTGTVKGNWVATISHFMSPSLGNFGSILFNNVNVDRSDHDAKIAFELAAFVRENKANKAMYDEFNGGAFALFSINAQVENLSLRNFMTKVADDRPVIRIGPDAKVEVMTAELSILDPDLRGVPLELDEGGRIDRLNLSVDWKGNSVDRGKNPIVSFGGTIAQLQWVNTPPMYVNAELTKGNNVVVTFSQDVKAADFKAGVSIKVNGEPVGISRALRQGRADVVHYVLETLPRPGDTITWAYDAADGNIRNLSGGQLLSVSEKIITNR